jgi:hypothetical protein
MRRFHGRRAEHRPETAGTLACFWTRLVRNSLSRHTAGILKHREALLRLDFDMVLSHYRVKNHEGRCRQVGAFDGVSGDCLYPMVERYGLTGVLVEPQRYAFAGLTSYLRFSGFQFVNAAIAAQDSTMTLYRIKPEAQGPSCLHQIASVDRNVLMRHASMIPNLESMVETETVRTVTFATLFKETRIERFDFCKLMPKGLTGKFFGYSILPLESRPSFASSKHLSVADHENCVGMLVSQGYKIVVCGSDTLPYRSSPVGLPDVCMTSFGNSNQ